MATPTNVVLEDDKDWIPWLEVTKTVALEHQLWDYINPSVALEKLIKLEAPAEPTLASIKALLPLTLSGSVTIKDRQIQQQPASLSTTAKVKFSDLNSREQAQLQMRQQLYLYQLYSYEKKQEAIGKLRSRIQSTISKKHF